MREIVLDTETTGLDPLSGDRIVEIGAVELWNHVATGATYHQYINPGRDMPIEAFNVHGLSAEFLSDKPRFREIAGEFLAFIKTDKLVIHNASFDMKFINAELKALKLPPIPMTQAIDTLMIARKRFPGATASLDALCRRFGIDNSSRTLHGALLDSEILAEVYLELTGGRQPDFGLGAATTRKSDGADTVAAADWTPPPRPRALAQRLSEAEREAHAAFVAKLGDGAIWIKRES
ncbi:MAG: DNA polymerase-3 subunit epsilon [Paracoccaceae bacterium]|jgi:DNA polymerase-3 subunit epsilon